MNIVLFGATGFSGRPVLDELLKRGHSVRAITRRADSLAQEAENLTITEGDVFDPTFLDRVLADADAVVNCLGIGGQGSGRPDDTVSRATTGIVQAMERSGRAKRFVCLSNVGAGDSWTYYPWFFRKLILPYFMKWLQAIIDDKNRLEPVVMASKLDWTLVRCPNIVDRSAGGRIVATTTGQGLGRSISRGDLATFIADELKNPRFIDRAPAVSN